MSIKQVKQIVKGFTTPEPTEEWYTKRMEICGGCKYNSNNIDPEKHTEATKLKLSTICKGDFVCTACGCCGSKKARVPESVCGKIEIGLTPEWGPITSKNPTDRGLSVSTSDPMVIVTDEARKVVLIRSYKEDEKKVEFKLKLDHIRKLQVVNVDASCSCTATMHEEVSDKSSNIKVEVSTVGFKGQVSERSLFIRYHTGSNRTETLSVTLRFEKDGK